MFVFVWSSRRSRRRALPQDLRTRLFSVWFCTKHLCFALEGQGMLCEASPHTTGSGQRPPAGLFLPAALFVAGRHILLPVRIVCCRSALFFVEINFLGRRPLFIYFMEIFCASCDSWHQLCFPPYTCMEGFPSKKLVWKALQRETSIRGALLSWL